MIQFPLYWPAKNNLLKNASRSTFKAALQIADRIKAIAIEITKLSKIVNGNGKTQSTWIDLIRSTDWACDPRIGTGRKSIP